MRKFQGCPVRRNHALGSLDFASTFHVAKFKRSSYEQHDPGLARVAEGRNDLVVLARFRDHLRRALADLAGGVLGQWQFRPAYSKFARGKRFETKAREPELEASTEFHGLAGTKSEIAVPEGIQLVKHGRRPASRATSQ